MDRAEDELVDKLLLQLINDHALGAKGQSLLLNGLEVFLLANVCEEALRGLEFVDKVAWWGDIRRRCSPIRQLA